MSKFLRFFGLAAILAAMAFSASNSASLKIASTKTDWNFLPTAEFEHATAWITNTSGNTISYKQKGEALEVTSGHIIEFCDNGTCYTNLTLTGQVYDNSLTRTIAAGATVGSESAGTTDIHFTANGAVGTSKAKFTYYNIEDPSDNIEVVLTFNVVISGTEEQITATISPAYPNPVNSVLNIPVPNNSIGNIQIIDSRGNIIKSLSINPNTESQQINVTDLNNGAYLYRINTQQNSSAHRFDVVK